MLTFDLRELNDRVKNAQELIDRVENVRMYEIVRAGCVLRLQCVGERRQTHSPCHDPTLT